jgi:2-phospho-L-lactate guanylyltransferase
VADQPLVWAIVPVKSLLESKRRLAHILSAEERADLIHRFLMHTLTVLNESGVIDRMLVVSSDERVLATAQIQGAELLVETAVLGLNPAVTHATQFAADSGATAVLILPADLPFIEKEDVVIMVEACRNNPNVVICSDNKGYGTNALLISPPTPFVFHYGLGSFQKHLQEAHKNGLTVNIVQRPGLQFDLDTTADWQKYQLTVQHSPFTIHNL